MVKNKDRKTELYRVWITDISNNGQDYNDQIILENIINDFFNKNLFNPVVKNVYEIKNKDLKYWFSSCENDNNILKVKLSYAIYNRNLKIINVDSFKTSKYKGKNEGDEEKQHLLIQHYPNNNKSVLVFERVTGAVTISALKKELNKYFHSCYPDLKDCTICISPVPSPDFLNELARMSRISLLKITVDREKSSIDEDIIFSEDNVCRDDVELVFKPFSKLSFSRFNVERYYKKFLEDNDKKVKRIVVEGKNERNRVRLDTEGMRLSKYISTALDLDGLVDTENIYENYEKLVKEDFKDYLSDIVLDINIEESE